MKNIWNAAKAMTGLTLLCLAVPTGATVPIAIAETGHVTVPVRINGAGPFQFVLDSGAEGTAVYARFAEEQHLPASGASETLLGQTGAAEMPMLLLETVEVDGSTARDIAAVRLDNRKDGVALAGILGLDVIGRGVADFDFANRRFSLLSRAAGEPLLRGKDALTADRVSGGLLAIPVLVNGIAGTGIIDSGARETRVNSAFARAAGLAPEQDGKAATIYGATNKAIEMVPARAGSVEFAGVTLRDRPIRIVDLPVFEQFGMADRPAMLLGADYLARLRMVIDFTDRRVWISEGSTLAAD